MERIQTLETRKAWQTADNPMTRKKPEHAPDALCRCGHAYKVHHHGKSCLKDSFLGYFCKCEKFILATPRKGAKEPHGR